MSPATVDPGNASRGELKEIFPKSPPGPIPAGQARGTAIILPGSWLDRVSAACVRALFMLEFPTGAGPA